MGEDQFLPYLHNIKKFITDRLVIFNKLRFSLKNQLYWLKDVFSGAEDIHSELIGIDIEASSILLLMINRHYTTIKLSFASICPLPIGVIREDVIVNTNMLDKTLKNFANQSAVWSSKKNPNSAISMTSSKILIKKIKLTHRINSVEAESLAWQEATKAFPGLIKNLFLDFFVSTEPSKEGQVEIYLTLVIARKEDVMPRIDILKDIGITSKIVDLDFEVLARAYRRLLAPQLPHGHENQNIAVLNFDPYSMLLIVMQQNHLRYHNRHTYAGDYLIGHVRKVLGLEFRPYVSYVSTSLPLNLPKKSDEEKKVIGTVPTINSDLISQEQKDHILTHVKRLLQYFYSEFSGESLNKIVLTGRCSLIPGVAEYLETRLNIPTVIINPFEKLKIYENVSMQSIFHLGPAFVLSCGLSLRGVAGWK